MWTDAKKIIKKKNIQNYDVDEIKYVRLYF